MPHHGKHKVTDAAQFKQALQDRDYAEVSQILTQNPNLVHQTSGPLSETLLHTAVDRQDLEAVRILLQHGAHWDVGDSVSTTPIHKAAFIGLPEILSEFIKASSQSKQSIDVLDCSKQTPLHVASERCQQDCAALLLNAGAQINIQDHQGFSPLHLAAQKHSVDMVKLLLDHGANVLTEAFKSPVLGAKIGGHPLHYAMSFHKPAHTQAMVSKLTDQQMRRSIAGYLDFASKQCQECNTCNLVQILVAEAQSRPIDYESLHPLLKKS